MGGPESTVLQGLLERSSDGDVEASKELFALVYADLRRLAVQRFAGEANGRTLQATALLHEAYLKVTQRGHTISAQNRRHLFGIFANAMKQVLVDAARARSALIRGGQRDRIPLVDNEARDAPAPGDEEWLVFSETLDRLAHEHPLPAEVARLKALAEIDLPQVAESIGVPLRTVERRWQFARAWLRREMAGARSTGRAGGLSGP